MDIRAFSKLVAPPGEHEKMIIASLLSIQPFSYVIIMQNTGQFRDLPYHCIFGDSDSEKKNRAIYKLAYSRD